MNQIRFRKYIDGSEVSVNKGPLGVLYVSDGNQSCAICAEDVIDGIMSGQWIPMPPAAKKPEREFPKTSLPYKDISRQIHGRTVEDAFNIIANAAIKQYILDQEAEKLKLSQVISSMYEQSAKDRLNVLKKHYQDQLKKDKQRADELTNCHRYFGKSIAEQLEKQKINNPESFHDCLAPIPTQDY